MRNTQLKVSILSCALLFLSAGQAQAITMNNLALTEKPFDFSLTTKKPAEDNKSEKPEQKTAEQKVEEKTIEKPVEVPVIQHAVAEGESLTSIATSYQTTWNRIYSKISLHEFLTRVSNIC